MKKKSDTAETSGKKAVAFYSRVSSVGQDVKSQTGDLESYASRCEAPVRNYTDKMTGTTMDRPSFNKMLEHARKGELQSIVVWRLDRLGRTAKGLTALFEELCEMKVNLVSLKDSLDLSTPAGRLMANVLASVAAYETEVRNERQAAGIAAAKLQGKSWGGRKAGENWKVSPEQERIVRGMFAEKRPVTLIAKTLNLSRPTVYRILNAK